MDRPRKTAITDSGKGKAKITVSTEEDSADITTSPSPTNADLPKTIQEFEIGPNAREIAVELPEDPFYSPPDMPSALPMHDRPPVLVVGLPYPHAAAMPPSQLHPPLTADQVYEIPMPTQAYDSLNMSSGVDRQAPSGWPAIWKQRSDSNAGTSEASYFRDPSRSVVLDTADWTSSYENNSSKAEILKRLESFKKYEVVQGYSDHHYRLGFPRTNPQGWSMRIRHEWSTLEKVLPDAIFVRTYMPGIEMLRAVIVGTDGTPYHDGLFFFDIRVLTTYPKDPPLVHYHSGGLQINPKLSASGDVLLRLLNTDWLPNASTVEQVLLSIQGMFLNAEPFCNEDGVEMESKDNSEYAFLLSLKTMLYSIKNPPKHFEDFVLGHFCNKAHHILRACTEYLHGAPVGSEVKATTEGDEKRCCGIFFRTHLRMYINALVTVFTEIGVQDCKKYTVPVDPSYLGKYLLM